MLPTRCGLKMTCCIISLRDENLVIDAALEWLIDRLWTAHELLFDLAQAIETGL